MTTSYVLESSLTRILIPQTALMLVLGTEREKKDTGHTTGRNSHYSYILNMLRNVTLQFNKRSSFSELLDLLRDSSL